MSYWIVRKHYVFNVFKSVINVVFSVDNVGFEYNDKQGS